MVQVGTAVAGIFGGKRQKRSAAKAAREALAFRKEQQKRVDEEVANYRAMKFTNPYAGMENPFEDLRVATDAAEFQAEQGAQQRANILSQLRGAAGASGIAGLAQSLANQGIIQARKISADLQRQEVANELAKAKGASAIDLQERAGEAMVQQAESGRQATILGTQYGQAAGANKNYQQALLNQRQANISANQMMMSSMKSLAKVDWGEGGTTQTSNFGIDNSLNLNTSPNLGYREGQMGGASGYGFGGDPSLTGLTWNPITQRFE